MVTSNLQPVTVDVYTKFERLLLMLLDSSDC